MFFVHARRGVDPADKLNVSGQRRSFLDGKNHKTCDEKREGKEHEDSNLESRHVLHQTRHGRRGVLWQRAVGRGERRIPSEALPRNHGACKSQRLGNRVNRFCVVPRERCVSGRNRHGCAVTRKHNRGIAIRLRVVATIVVVCGRRAEQHFARQPRVPSVSAFPPRPAGHGTAAWPHGVCHDAQLRASAAPTALNTLYMRKRWSACVLASGRNEGFLITQWDVQRALSD
jgi:hypothetical protein